MERWKMMRWRYLLIIVLASAVALAVIVEAQNRTPKPQKVKLYNETERLEAVDQILNPVSNAVDRYVRVSRKFQSAAGPEAFGGAIAIESAARSQALWEEFFKEQSGRIFSASGHGNAEVLRACEPLKQRPAEYFGCVSKASGALAKALAGNTVQTLGMIWQGGDGFKAWLEQRVINSTAEHGPDDERTVASIRDLGSALFVRAEAFDRIITFLEKVRPSPRRSLATALTYRCIIGSTSDSDHVPVCERAALSLSQSPERNFLDEARVFESLRAGAWESPTKASEYGRRSLSAYKSAFGPSSVQFAQRLVIAAYFLHTSSRDLPSVREYLVRAQQIYRGAGGESIALASNIEQIMADLPMGRSYEGYWKEFEEQNQKLFETAGPAGVLAYVSKTLSVPGDKMSQAESDRLLVFVQHLFDIANEMAIRNLAPADRWDQLSADLPVVVSVLMDRYSGTQAFARCYQYMLRFKGLMANSLRSTGGITPLSIDDPSASVATQLAKVGQRIYSGGDGDSIFLDLKKLVPGIMAGPPQDIDLSGLLRPDEAVVDFYRYQPLSGPHKRSNQLLAVISRHGSMPERLLLGPASPIEDAVLAWRSSLKPELQSDPDSILRGIIDAVWRPIIARLPFSVTKVIVSPDDTLTLLPWPTVATGGNRPLLVSTVTSAVQLVNLRKEQRRPPQVPSLLLVRAVDYGASQKSEFTPLITTEEGVELAARSSGLKVTVLQGERATKNNLRLVAKDYSFIHFATHAESKANQGAYSPDSAFLAMAGANKGRDGLLSATELMSFDFARADLVTLAACETAVGDPSPGHAMITLQTGIMSAGARSVLASLWRVPDDATSLLMTYFYRNLWERRTSKAEALRLAQVEVRREPQFQHPWFWAAWTIQGEAW